jgi:aryl-alcohol dehydrogenase-like predicted oxidoreductase
MGMSFAYGEVDEDACTRTLETALEIGVNFWDTSDFYGLGENERFLGAFLKRRRDKVVLATKCGIVAKDGNPRDQVLNTTPDYIRAACDASLQRLGTEVIDLYYLHRLDGATPLEDTMGALADLHKEGKIRAAGLSEVSERTIRQAHAVFPVAAVQNEYSLMSRDAETEATIDCCAEIGASFVPYAPICRGLLTNTLKTGDAFGARDYRSILPRFSESALESNNRLVDNVATIAEGIGCTPVQLSLAWVISRGPHVIPIPGTRKPDRLRENAAAADIALTADDRARLMSAVPISEIVGDRYSSINNRGLA